MHKDRGRALSFGSVAERYERARPGYPAALIDGLMTTNPRHVLDVGCGTGKAARLLLERGCEVVAVEPDERMAAVARAHGVTVELSPFEAWDADGRNFDLVISAQAWHWIDPVIGPTKAAAVLRPRGHLALFWNRVRHNAPVMAVLDSVYRQHAPDLADTSTALGRLHDEHRRDENPVTNPGLFGPVDLRFFDSQTTFSRDAWLDYLSTCSDHITLPPATRSRLLEAVGAAIDAELGGHLVVDIRTKLVSTRRTEG